MFRLKTGIIKIFFVLVCLLALALPGKAASGEALKIVYNPGVDPLKFEDASGEPSGILPDIWRLWAKKAGREIRFIKAESFDESLNFIKNGRADLHAGIFKTEEREQFLKYSSPILTVNYHIFTHPSVKPVHTMAETTGLVIGIQKGGFTENWVRSRIPAQRIAVYDSFTDLFKAAQRGEVRVFIATKLSLLYYLTQARLANIYAFDEQHPLYSQAYHTATSAGNPSLIESVNLGLSAITQEEREQVEGKWMVSNTRKIPDTFASLLTEEELSFLSQTVTIKVHNETDWAPFNYNEDGIPKGFSIDYVSLLAERTGFEVQFLNYPSWQEFLSLIKSGELDVMMNIARTSEREAYLEYTSSYVAVDQILLTRQDFPAVTSAEDLFGKTIAVPRGFYIRSILQQYPKIIILDVDNMTEAVRAVSEGKADGTVNPEAVITRVMDQLGIVNLKINTDLKIFGISSVPIHMAVSKNRPILAAILEKGMTQISDAEIQGLQKKWLGSGEEPTAIFDLTPREREWLKAHPVLRVGIDPGFAPFEFIEDEKYKGMASDYMDLISRRLGIKLVPETQLTWNEAIEKAKRREIDLLPCIGITEERKHYFIFSNPYLDYVRVIITRNDARVNSLKDLEGLRVAVQKNSSNHGFIKEQTALEPILYPTFEDALMALSLNQADAVIGNLAVAAHVMRKRIFTNLKIAAHASTEIHPLAMAVRNDWPELVGILNKTLMSITTEEHKAIRSRWIDIDMSKQRGAQVQLTPKEQAFIASHKPLVFSEVNWKPLSIADNPQGYDGMIADYLKFISERSGLKFEFQMTESDTWAEVLKKYVDRKIDVVPALSRDDDIGREILLSEPFVTFPLVIVTRNDVSYIKDTKQLKGKKVAVGRGYTSYHFLNKHYPEIELVQTDNVREALIKLSNNEVFAFVDHVAVAIDNLQMFGFKNLKIGGETEYLFDHRIGVDPKYSDAVSIINKVLSSMSDEEHQIIYRKWLHVEYEKGIDYTLVWQIIGSAALLFIVVLFWTAKLENLNRKLSMEISERIKSEKALEESERRLTDIINFLPDPVLVIDNQGRVAAWNKAIESLTGVNARDMIGKSDYEYALPFYGERRPILIDLVRQWDETVAETYLSIQRDGDYLITEVYNPHLRNGSYLSGKAGRLYNASGEIMGAVMTIRDVTERHRADEIVRKSEKRFRSLVSNLQGVVYRCVVDKFWTKHYISDAVFDLTGYRAEDFLHNRTLSFKDIYYPDDSERIHREAMAAIEKKQPFEIEYRIITAKGETRWVFEKGSGIWENETDTMPAWLDGIIFDITGRKSMEQEIMKARDAAEAANRAKSMFLANMSHEIRTPMNSTIGFISLVLDDPAISEKHRNYLSTAYNSSKALLNLINDILDISKLENGRLELEKTPFNPRGVVEETLRSLDIAAKNKGLALNLKMDAAVPRTMIGDPGRLKQILVNLVGNAIKFTEQGIVTIGVKFNPLPLPSLYFSIADTGIGIPADRLQSIFDPFTQADASTTRRFGGTGLGTTISKQLVQLMGGSIGVKSQEGKGSLFYFTIPLAPSESEQMDLSAEPADPPPPVSRCFNILMAEDIEANILLAKIRLKQQGHRVITVRNGREALKLFEKEHPDIILMDVHMPEMDGLEAARRIRELESLAPGEMKKEKTPIIALTASVMAEDQQICLAAGMDAVVGKPVNFNELFQTMEQLVPEGREKSAANNPLAAARDSLPEQREINGSPFMTHASLDWKKGIEIWQHPEVYEKSLRRFANDYEKAVEKIQHLIADGDRDGAYQFVHALKGIAGNLCVTKVSRISGDLAAQIREKPLDELLPVIESLGTELNAFVDGVQRSEPRAVKKEIPPKALDAAALKKLFREMLTGFEEYNPADVEPFLDQLAQSLPSHQIKPLKDRLDRFDLDGAKMETVKLAAALGVEIESAG